MLFEDAFAIVKFALRVVEFADRRTIEKRYTRNPFRDGMPVRARVAVNRRADRSGNPRHRFQAFQSCIDGEIDERLQRGAALDMDRLPLQMPIDVVDNASTTHHLVMSGGKDGQFYVMNPRKHGGITTSTQNNACQHSIFLSLERCECLSPRVLQRDCLYCPWPRRI